MSIFIHILGFNSDEYWLNRAFQNFQFLTEDNFYTTIEGDGKYADRNYLEKLLTPEDICGLLSIRISKLYDLTHKKDIPHFKINGLLRFRQSNIEEWINSKEVR